MAVTIHLNGTSLSLAHKGCSGITKCTLPDVCKTPSPGGPVPIPYPVIISMASTLQDGTTTVKVDGGNPAAIKGSKYGSCNGDEAGTAGGVKSSTNMKEATWILYSFDVKLDGKNACRLSDKMMMNKENTACLGGTLHIDVPKLATCDLKGLQELAKACNEAINCSKADGGPCPEASPSGNAASNPGGSDCTTLGTKKHECCEEAINKHVEENPGCGFQSEVVYPIGADKDAKKKAGAAYKQKVDDYKARGRTEAQARGYCRRDRVFQKALGANGPKFIADVLQGSPPTAGFDFKFNCADSGEMEQTQIDKYKEYANVPVTMVHADGRSCAGCAG
jgi:hypothetical protein